MSKYELLLVLPGTLDDNEVAARSEEIVQEIKALAQDVEVTTMGKNRLAYPIKQIRYGYYFAITFKAATKDVKILEKKFSLTRDILRAGISHWRSELSPQQKLAYTTGQMQPERVETESVAVVQPTTPAVQPVQRNLAEEMATIVPADKAPVEESKPKVTKKAEELDMDAINKKLDDLMSGDVITGV